MTERDLQSLKDLPVPPARGIAKRQAIAEALDAFDASELHGEIDGDATDDDSKGRPIPLRQIAAYEAKRTSRMDFATRPRLALAASVVALMIAAPMAFHIGRQSHPAAPVDLVRAIDATKIAGSDAPAGVSVTPPLVVDRQELALKGADPAQRRLVDPTDGLGAVAGDSKTRTITIGGGKSETADIGAAKAKIDASVANLTEQMLNAERANGPSLAAGVARSDPAVQAAAIAAPPPPASYAAGQPYEMRSRLGGLIDFTGKDGRVAGVAASLDQDKAAALPTHDEFRDTFDGRDINPVKQVATEPVSTFSIDVDTASYSFVRRALNAGMLPPKDAVRVEELINYFPYAYPAPATAETPFKPTVTVMPSPWNANNKLVHVAIKGYEITSAERPRANLVFLMDVSGSMQDEDRLPLVKNAFRLLLDQLRPDDTVGIVTYAGESGIALEPTKASDKAKILSAIDKLGAGGSTAGADGIQDAYRLAEANFDKASVNRIILATDGDFNVGITDQEQLKGLIERKRQSGIFLSILGVGRGNFNDALMQTLAQNGNGTAAYVDTLNEARKVLVDESSSTLFPIAKDVKLQIEWNPARVSEYRLIGYETRVLNREDFNNDRVDAGDIGSGHTVTAIYEVTPVGAPKLVDDLRYSKKLATADAAPPPVVKTAPSATTDKDADELGFLKMRFKRPNEDTSQLVDVPITNALAVDGVAVAPEDVRFSVAVSAFGQLMRGAPYTLNYSYDDVLALAQTARGQDPFGYRAEFLNLVRLAKSARP